MIQTPFASPSFVFSVRRLLLIFFALLSSQPQILCIVAFPSYLSMCYKIPYAIYPTGLSEFPFSYTLLTPMNLRHTRPTFDRPE